MKSGAVALLAALGIFAVWAYKKYSTLLNLLFVPRGFTVDTNGFHVILGVQNTSNQTVQYNSFAGTLTVNGTAIGNVSDFSSRLIAANGETQLMFTITPNILGLTNQLVSQLSSGLTGIDSANIQGVANISGGQYPVNVNLV